MTLNRPFRAAAALACGLCAGVLALTPAAATAGSVRVEWETLAPQAGGQQPVKVFGVDPAIATGTGAAVQSAAAPACTAPGGSAVPCWARVRAISGAVIVAVSGTASATNGTRIEQGDERLFPANAGDRLSLLEVAVGATASIDTSSLATAANQAAPQASPGADASKAVAVQGVTGGKAVPVSAASLPLPSGAATSAAQTTAQSSLTNLESYDSRLLSSAAAVGPASPLATTSFLSGCRYVSAGVTFANTQQGAISCDSAGRILTSSVGPEVAGSAVTGGGVRMMGSDGTNARDVKTDTSGDQFVIGTKPNDGSQSASGGTHLTVGGVNPSGNYAPAQVDASGDFKTTSQDCVEGVYSATGVNASGVVTFTKPGGGTASAIDVSSCGYVIAQTPVPGSGNTVALQFSADGSTYISSQGDNAAALNSTISTNFNPGSNLLFVAPVMGSTVRANVTTLTSGPLSIYVTVKRAAYPAAPVQTVAMSLGGTQTIQAANGMNTTGTGLPVGQQASQCDDVSQTALTENSFGNTRLTCGNHAQVVWPFEDAANSWSFPAPSGGWTDTTGHTVHAACGAALKNYIVGIQIANLSATATDVQLRDGASGTVIWRGYATANMQLTSVNLSVPIPGAANTLVEGANGTTSSGAVVNVQGFCAP